MVTLGDTIKANNGNSPGYHFIRHALAFAILLWHGFYIVKGTTSVAPLADGVSASLFLKTGLAPATMAGLAKYYAFIQPLIMSLVGGFFVLSGFLVTGSALRTRNVRIFLSFRILRIVPALFSEVTLSAILLGPLVTSVTLAHYFSDPKFVSYFGNIAGFIHYELPSVFVTNPWPKVVNANLWTLPPEFYCYLLLSAAMLSKAFYSRRAFLLFFAIASCAIFLEEIFHVFQLQTRTDSTHFSGWFIVYLFFAGSFLWHFSDKVPLRLDLLLLSLVGYYCCIYFALSDVLAGLLLAYMVVYCGTLTFTNFDRIWRLDLSYGVYLYGFPICQAMTYFWNDSLSRSPLALKYAAIIGPATLLTILFASVSWFYIEKPALRAKAYISPKPKAALTPATLLQ